MYFYNQFKKINGIKTSNYQVKMKNRKFLLDENIKVKYPEMENYYDGILELDQNGEISDSLDLREDM